MKKMIIITCLSLASLPVFSQEKNHSQKVASPATAQLATISESSVVTTIAGEKATLSPGGDINAIPVPGKLKPERVKGPGRSDFINYGKPVPPKQFFKEEEKKKQ